MGNIISEGSAAAGGSGILAASLLTELGDTVLHDAGSVTYPTTLRYAAWNRAQNEIYALLRRLGAEIATLPVTFTGAATPVARAALPTNPAFLAFVPGSVRPRSPIDATADYQHDTPLEHKDRHGYFMQAATTIGLPRIYTLELDTVWYIKFPCKLATGYKIDAWYWPKMEQLAAANAATLYQPWEGLFDDMFRTTLELWLKAGAEYTTEQLEAWKAQTYIELKELCGQRHVMTQEAFASLYRGMHY